MDVPLPITNEQPTEYANRLGRSYVLSTSKEHKMNLGQYLTPVEIASFMASLFKPDTGQEKICILDPGAGTGILSCAVCELLGTNRRKLSQIQLVAYEVDKNLIPYLKNSLEYTRLWLQERGVTLSYKIKTDDFILENAGIANKTTRLNSTKVSQDMFDLVISNPPYFKISKSDPRAKAVPWIISGQPNIYSLFMVISASLLRARGQLIFITPRSYTSGPYFRLFREKFFSMVKPELIHLFSSRKGAFKRDDILQENVILKAQRHTAGPKNEEGIPLTVSLSEDSKDIRHSTRRDILLSASLNLQSHSKMLGIPASVHDEEIIRLVHSWEGHLSNYHMSISTGPVVPFRATEFISDKTKETETHTPLLWMQNVRPMLVRWPASTKKRQAIKISSDSMSLLVASKNYVLLRRFSAKEENRRLVAAPLIKNTFKSKYLGLENHLNYIHRPGGELLPEEIYGLSAIYNCGLLDTYFRIFNGNTQVSATELREMPLPSLEKIKEIGRYVIAHPMSFEEMDMWVTSILSINTEYSRRICDVYEQNTGSTGNS